MKDRVVLILVIGILLMLFSIIAIDYSVAVKESRPLDVSITNLLQITITGLIGILGAYIGVNKKDE